MRSAPAHTGVVILGAGPSSLAPLFQAAAGGDLDRLLRDGVVVVERSHRPGPAWFPSAPEHAQQLAFEIQDWVEIAGQPAMVSLRAHGATRSLRQVRAASDGQPFHAPRAVVLAFLAAAVTAMLDLLRSQRTCHVCLGAEATPLRKNEDDRLILSIRNLRNGESREMEAAQLWQDGHALDSSFLPSEAEPVAAQRALAPVEEISIHRRRLQEKEQRMYEGELSYAAAGSLAGTSSMQIPTLRTADESDATRAGDMADANAQFESRLIETTFHGVGGCVTVNNATTGLMLAMREVLGERPKAWRKYALMPSFTFAAAAQAALWCGLTPLLCDVDPETWLPSAEAEEMLLKSYAGQIAVVLPSATFGNNLDLKRYSELSRRHRVPVVVDAAASLGSESARGEAFGKGFEWPVVFSMHASTAFSTAEGGLVYCADRERLQRIRQMCCFGLDDSGCATVAGLNARLPESGARAAALQLQELPGVLAHQAELVDAYARELPPELLTQHMRGRTQARGFVPVLLPEDQKARRAEIIEHLRLSGVRVGTHFSPHLAEQPYLRRHSVLGPLSATEDLASRILTLPLVREMSVEDVLHVTTELRRALQALTQSASRLETVA